MLCNSEVKNPPPVHGDAYIFNIGRGLYLLQNLLESDAVSYHPYWGFERGEQLLWFRVVISTKSHLLDDGAFFQIETSEEDRKSTRLNSSHVAISYAVFCLKKT